MLHIAMKLLDVIKKYLVMHIWDITSCCVILFYQAISAYGQWRRDCDIFTNLPANSKISQFHIAFIEKSRELLIFMVIKSYDFHVLSVKLEKVFYFLDVTSTCSPSLPSSIFFLWRCSQIDMEIDS